MRHALLATAAAAALLAAPTLAQNALAQNTGGARDGTPGNPPSTATQRALDGVTGNRTPADGTPGNPPGTALGRAAESAGNAAAGAAAGANARAGDPANTANAPDGTPGNPPGTAVSRAFDRAAGTNISGANPQNNDGGASNPPGTAFGRAFGQTTQGNERTPGEPGGAPSSPRATSSDPAVMGSTQPGAGAAMGSGTGTAARDNSTTSDTPRAGAGNNVAQSGGSVTANPNNPPAQASPRTSTGTQPSAAMGSGTTGGGTGTTAEAATPAERASRIIGSNVYNERNEAVGSVDDIILGGNASGPLAVVSVGGFLGIGAKLVAVPFSQLRWNGNDNRWVITGATRESLTSLPSYAYDSSRRG